MIKFRRRRTQPPVRFEFANEEAALSFVARCQSVGLRMSKVGTDVFVPAPDVVRATPIAEVVWRRTHKNREQNGSNL